MPSAKLAKMILKLDLACDSNSLINARCHVTNLPLADLLDRISIMSSIVTDSSIGIPIHGDCIYLAELPIIYDV